MRPLPALALLLSLVAPIALAAQGASDQCDPTQLKAIFKRSLKVADERLGQAYQLIAENTASSQNHEKLRSTHPVECTQADHWPSTWVDSEFATVATRDNVEHGDRSCFLSRPLFNQEGTDCVVVLSIHQGEWGGWTGYLHFKRRGGKWKHVRTSVVSVS